jgi:hypothetical protein
MFDKILELKDTGKVTSSGYGTVGGEASIVYLGTGLVRGNAIFDVIQLKISSNDELYRMHLIGGSDESFTEEVSLCEIELGASEVVEGNQDSMVSRYILPFQNEQAGTTYPYLRIRHELSGSSPEINYSARFTKDIVMRGTPNITVSTTTTTTTTV